MLSDDPDDSESWLLELINYNREVHWLHLKTHCACLGPHLAIPNRMHQASLQASSSPSTSSDVSMETSAEPHAEPVPQVHT